MITDYDLHLLGEGRHWQSYQKLGAHLVTQSGVAGVRFAVWAPNADAVSVAGDFNDWDGRRHPLRRLPSAGIWEAFVPGATAGTTYKYLVTGADGVT
jgi:1,4-alpha-glucan branching enzyme